MHEHGRRIALLALGTAVPPYRVTQKAAVDWMARSFAGQPALGRWLRSLYANSGIETRHACVPDFIRPPELSRLAPGLDPAEMLTTAERMDIYERESVGIGTAAARQALASYGQATSQDYPAVAETVTHLIVVSCTGFFAPGLDIAIARQLNLAPTVERSLIGFMGCAAAFNGLRAATQVVRGDPSARVLVVCVELCSLHVQPGANRENLIAGSLFADGASACLVGEAMPHQGNLFEVEAFFTSIKPDTRNEMVWQIGNHGFALRLSPRIPEHLAEAAPEAVDQLFGQRTSPRFWAIHPGGRAIVDRLAEIFCLEPEQVAASRSVLRRFGNLSSATMFFVLNEIRQKLGQEGTKTGRIEGVAMAFGPGLVIEMARLAYVPPAAPAGRNGQRAVEVVSRVVPA